MLRGILMSHPSSSNMVRLSSNIIFNLSFEFVRIPLKIFITFSTSLIAADKSEFICCDWLLRENVNEHFFFKYS